MPQRVPHSGQNRSTLDGGDPGLGTDVIPFVGFDSSLVSLTVSGAELSESIVISLSTGIETDATFGSQNESTLHSNGFLPYVLRCH